MKEVIYKNGDEYLLTDKEFAQAIVNWNEKKSYWFEREERMLTPFYESAGTPPLQLGKEMLLDVTPRRAELFFKKNDKWYSCLNGKGNGTIEVKFSNKEEEEAFAKRLIPQDDFYNNDTKLLK